MSLSHRSPFALLVLVALTLGWAPPLFAADAGALAAPAALRLLTPAAAGQVKLVLVGIGMMLLMIFRPQGILGNKEEVLIDER